MNFRIITQPRAVRDLTRITAWLTERSTEAASLWLHAYDDAIEKIRMQPLAFSAADEERCLRRGLRQHLFQTRLGNTYRVVYVISAAEISVLRVIAPGQRPLRAGDLG